VAYAAHRGHQQLGAAHAGLPDDLLLFLHDPLTCAVAVGWDGCRTEQTPLLPVESGGVLSFVGDPAGRPSRAVTGVDGPAFTRRWLEAVAAT
jgi:hypothetical protein